MLTVLVAVALFGGITTLWVEVAVFDEDHFADRAARLLESSDVREAVATRMVDQIIDSGGAQLIPYRSVVISVTADLASTEQFRGLFHQGVAQAHRSVFTEDGSAVAVNLTGAIGILVSSLAVSNPEAAARVPDGIGELIIGGTDQVRRLELWQIVEDLSSLAESLLVFALVGSIAIIYLSPQRRRGVRRVGAVVVGAGIAGITLSFVIPMVMSGRVSDPDLSAALRVLFEDFVGDLRSMGTWTVAIGVVIAALATAGVPTRQAASPRELWHRTAGLAAEWTPATPVGQALRATAVVAVGIWLILWRDSVVPLAVVVFGAYIGYVGLIELLGVIGRPRAAGARTIAPGEPVEGEAPTVPPVSNATRGPRILWLSATAIALVAVIAVAAWVHVRAERRQAVAAPVTVCNGSVELCDRRIDEVAFAASHNSMSAAASGGWIFAQNRYSIADQLEWGVRGLLVKTHYGVPTGITLTGADLIVTDRAAEVNANPERMGDDLPDGAAERAESLAAGQSVDPARRHVYLCHVYCELGAQRFSDALQEIRTFLDRNPSEVVFLVVGDYVSIDDTRQAFEAAGLAERLWEHDPRRPLPTLQEMIDADRQIFHMAEFSETPPAWNNPAYGPDGLIQDTPYTFTAPSQLQGTRIPMSCQPNRGADNSPLFQVNHWITNDQPPSITVAREVNAYDVLMPRVKGCMEERGLFPTLIGVNYYDQGDLLRVIDELNGLETPRT